MISRDDIAKKLWQKFETSLAIVIDGKLSLGLRIFLFHLDHLTNYWDRCLRLSQTSTTTVGAGTPSAIITDIQAMMIQRALSTAGTGSTGRSEA